MIKRLFLLLFGALLLIVVVSIVITFAFYNPNNIAVIEVRGVIMDSREVIDKIISYRERDDVKAIVLRIDSPGGAVGPAQEIHRELVKTAKEKRVIVSMASVAASGGYYIATAADKIIANPGTITGSIGVVMEFNNVEGLLSKVGLKNFVIKSGEFKDMGSPLREMNEKEKKLLQDMLDNVHGQFINAVAEGRKLEVDEVKKFADGRIFTGAQAMEYKLVDQLGNLQSAIELAAEMAGIEEKPGVIYPKRGGLSLLNLLSKLRLDSLLNHSLNPSYSPLYLMYI